MSIYDINVEGCLATFKTRHLHKIDGEPNFAALFDLKQQLKDNASSIPSSLGGGQHGHLGLVLSENEYATVAPETPFIIPPFPGIHPHIPVGANIRQARTLKEEFEARIREYTTCVATHTALKQQLFAAVHDDYTSTLKDSNSGYAGVTLQQLLEHLFDVYGNIDAQMISDNYTAMNTPWNPTSPFENLVKQIETGQQFAKAGGAELSETLILVIAYNLIFNTGLYFRPCEKWNLKPAHEKTWTNFKQHFRNATKLLKQRQAATQHNPAGRFANTVEHDNHIRDIVFQCMPYGFQQPTGYNPTPPPQAAAATTNDKLDILLDQLMKRDKERETQLQELTTQVKQLTSHNRNRTGTAKRAPTHYCWTHGYTLSDKHTSKNCTRRVEGHKEEATMNNRMEGSERNKPKN